jgi:hypothetical protein
MIPQIRRALLVAAAGACLGLSACGGGSVTPASKPAAGPSIAVRPMKLTGHFCHDVKAIMGQQPSDPAGQKATLDGARTQMEKMLRRAVAGYTALEPEAPSRLQGPMKTMVGVYTADERHLASYGSVTQLGAAIVKANTTGAGGAAFRKVATYMMGNCR